MDLPIVSRIKEFATHAAVVDSTGSHTYAALLDRAKAIVIAMGVRDLREARVAFLAEPGADFVATLLGIWMAGGVAVPLCRDHPTPEISHVLEDSGASMVLADQAHADRLDRAVIRLEAVSDDASRFRSCDTAIKRRALILYTSGTTGRPKGVVTTHAQVEAAIRPLISAWGWTEQDRILHVLPLHHMHGLVNALLCCLWSGATCVMLPRFEARAVWGALRKVTLFMGVPTMYHRLLKAWDEAGEKVRVKWSNNCLGVRLMVSGSSALPVDIFKRWEKATGHRLLERYGMTEIGMALSNPLKGERRLGTVGLPLPGVQVRLMSEAGSLITQEGTAGELYVLSPSIFQEYWRLPEVTAASFRDGWFATGDMAVIEDGYYRIMGRKSIDIIKTGGFKVSALEIENVLRGHMVIADCAVVGVPDDNWGEAVSAAVVLHPGCSLSLEDMRFWVKKQLVYYKVPTRLRVVDALPVNAVGKVQKTVIRAAFERFA